MLVTLVARLTLRYFQYLAQEIAENGREFVKEHWRWEVMQAYMFRLLLE